MMFAIWWALRLAHAVRDAALLRHQLRGRYWWTGGAYLRMDWLFAMRRQHLLHEEGQAVRLAACFIAYATLLRVFPGFVAAALILKIVVASVRARKLVLDAGAEALRSPAARSRSPCSCRCRRCTAAASSTWRGFVSNSRKHLQTPLTNNMGWRTVIAYDRATRAQVDRDNRVDRSVPHVEERTSSTNFHQRLLVYLVGLLGFLVLLGMAVEKHPDWVALTLGTGLIIFAAQLTCYYFIAFIAFALLWPYLPWSGWALALLELR